MNKDQTDGRIEEAKGKVKEAAGKIVGNKELEQTGTSQNTIGRARSALGDAKADVKAALNK